MKTVILSGAAGHMGRVVAQIIAAREDSTVTAGVDICTEPYADFPILPDFSGLSGDVIIDFSSPAALEPLLDFAVQTCTPAVIATTGYDKAGVQRIQEASKRVPIFFSFNMSLGVNLLASLAKQAEAVLGESFDVEIIEKHHNRKVDAPSGTALMLADALNEQAGGRFTYVYDRHTVRERRDKRELGIHAVRGGTIVGEHEILFCGRDEIITLSHSARSRDIFAVGAVNAAMFLCTRPAGLYDMKSLIAAC